MEGCAPFCGAPQGGVDARAQAGLSPHAPHSPAHEVSPFPHYILFHVAESVATPTVVVPDRRSPRRREKAESLAKANRRSPIRDQ